MSDINCFFFPFPSLKNNFVTTAMKRFFPSDKKKIFQFIYQSFGHVIGIINYSAISAFTTILSLGKLPVHFLIR